MKHCRKTLFIILALIVLCFCACGVDSKHSVEFFAMDTVMSVTAYGSNSETALKEAEDKINRLDSLLSALDSNSEIYRLNTAKELKASGDVCKILSRCLELSELTGGAFDVTTQPLSKLWGFYSGEENRVPSASQIKNALSAVGYENISVSGDSVSLKGGACVDLGGIAKGYAAGAAAEILKDRGVTSALISLGGNVRAVGLKPDGSRWSVAVTDPKNTGEQLGALSVEDVAVVTSGGYQRFFTEKGITYHHILDPETGRPAESGLKSVTVVSRDDASADALSTGLFVMGLEEGCRLYRENSSLFGCVIVDDRDNIYVTENLEKIFSSQRSFEVIRA